MHSYDDIRMMYDWNCSTADQARRFVPLYITDEEAEKIINNEESAS